jgi:hypothetical protein
MASGLVIDRASAAFLPNGETDPDVENEFGYTGLRLKGSLERWMKR